MSFDFEIAMQVLEELNKDEREALFNAAKFLLSTTTPKGAYAFSAINVRSIDVKHMESFAPVQSDAGGYRTRAGAGVEVMRGGGTVEVTFRCAASQFRGMFIQPGPAVPEPGVERKMEPCPEPPTPMEEQKEIDKMLSRITYKRSSREHLLK